MIRSVKPDSPRLDSGGTVSHTSLLQSAKSNVKVNLARGALSFVGQGEKSTWGRMEKTPGSFGTKAALKK